MSEGLSAEQVKRQRESAKTLSDWLYKHYPSEETDIAVAALDVLKRLDATEYSHPSIPSREALLEAIESHHASHMPMRQTANGWVPCECGKSDGESYFDHLNAHIIDDAILPLMHSTPKTNEEVTEAEFDALTDLLAEKRDEWPRLVNDMASEDLADEIFKAGYRKPRIVSTAEELDSLPLNSVILDEGGMARQTWARSDGQNTWVEAGGEDGMSSVELVQHVIECGVNSVFTVLYVPVSSEGGEAE